MKCDAMVPLSLSTQSIPFPKKSKSIIHMHYIASNSEERIIILWWYDNNVREEKMCVLFSEPCWY